MKKSAITIILLTIFLIIYFLQVNFFSWFNIAGVKPNLFVVLAFIIGLFAGNSKGITFGAIMGICLDFFLGKNIGLTAIMLGIVGFLGGYLDKKFSKDSRFTMIIMIIIVTLIYEIGIYVFNHFINNVNIGVLLFTRIMFLEIFYNIVLTIILYPLILKLGYKLEKTYKDNRILTRYF